MLEVVIIIGILILLFIMDRLIKKNKINFKFVYLNFFVLIVFIVIVSLFLIPGVNQLVVQKTGFFPSDLLISLGIAYLFYALFIQGVIIAKQNEKIDKIAMIISVNQSLTERGKNEKNSNSN